MDVLPHLNTILSTHETQLDIVVSLAIQALAVMVDNKVLDIESTWEVISDHLRDTDRPLVLSSICQFLALSCDDTTGQVSVANHTFIVCFHRVFSVLRLMRFEMDTDGTTAVQMVCRSSRA